LRVNLERLKEHGLLPQHFADPVYDESSSFQNFEPVIVAATYTEEAERKEMSGKKNLLTVEPNEQSHSLMSVESSRTSSIRKKSVTNSNYLRTRLSAMKNEGAIETE